MDTNVQAPFLNGTIFYQHAAEPRPVFLSLYFDKWITGSVNHDDIGDDEL